MAIAAWALMSSSPFTSISRYCCKICGGSASLSAAGSAGSRASKASKLRAGGGRTAFGEGAGTGLFDVRRFLIPAAPPPPRSSRSSAS